MTSLYERIGGEAAVKAAVDKFYSKILADANLAPFFAGVDMQRQQRHQENFMTFAFGGPNRYNGRGLRAAHAKLVHDKGLNDGHFDAVAGHLKATLEELSVAPALVQEVLTLVGGTRADVLAG